MSTTGRTIISWGRIRSPVFVFVKIISHVRRSLSSTWARHSVQDPIPRDGMIQLDSAALSPCFVLFLIIASPSIRGRSQFVQRFFWAQDSRILIDSAFCRVNIVRDLDRRIHTCSDAPQSIFSLMMEKEKEILVPAVGCCKLETNVCLG